MSKQTNKQAALPAPANETASEAKSNKANHSVYSIPASREDKEYFLNMARHTGLSQKDLLTKAVEALKSGPPLPAALPIKLS